MHLNYLVQETSCIYLTESDSELVYIIDTLCSFEKVIQRVEKVLNTQSNTCINSQKASIFFFNWYNTALRDYIATSLAGRYCPLKKVLKATLVRALYHEGLEEPIDEDMMMEALKAIEPSATAFDALRLLNNHKEWDVWILSSSGTHEETIEFLKHVGLLDYVNTHNILCCDNLRISRPHPKVYSELMRLAVHQTKRIEVTYFFLKRKKHKHDTSFLILELLFRWFMCV